MIDSSIIQQVTDIFANLDSRYTLSAHISSEHESGAQMAEFLNDFATTSSHIGVEHHKATGNTLYFDLLKEDKPTGITFRGIPNGHEFTSLLLAILNADGKGKNIPVESYMTLELRTESGTAMRIQGNFTSEHLGIIMSSLR